MASTDESEYAELLKWLIAHGVTRKKAEDFCAASGCRTLQSVALYLRFQLALPCSNEDTINTDMKNLLGASPLQGKTIIKDLDVENAVSLDTTGEATAFLEVTGQLPQKGLREHLAEASGSILWGASHPITGPAPSADLNGTSYHTLQPIDEGTKPAAATGMDSAVLKGTAPKSHGRHSTTLPTTNSLKLYRESTTGGVSAGLSMSLAQSGLRHSLNMRGAGCPTGSHALDPGPYHKANAQFRKQLGQYHATVTVRFVWLNFSQWILAFISWAAYVGVRVAYLVTGKSADLMGDLQASTIYSIIVLVTETVIGVISLFGTVRFWKQEVQFAKVDTAKQDYHDAARQSVHVLITTYTEPLEIVRECVIRCLVAPEPSNMEKNIFVCDDGHAKSDGPKKRAMVEELRILGHTNVFYIGDRVKRPGQLNGKSANLNHAILQKVYPGAQTPNDIPSKDMILVMDVDHLLKPDVFNRMGPCMMDERVAVTLVPQSFHNVLLPDAFDFSNANFMFTMLPYYFGAGACFITGTNVMIRARTCFEVCKGSAKAMHTEDLEEGVDLRQVYAEDQVSEDVELGSRIHAAGFKSVFLAENLATGEVPLDPRSMWRQRLRWAKGGHLYALAPDAVVWGTSPHLSLYQKILYCFPVFAHFVAIWAEPILFTLPFVCLVLGVCPYGMDQLLYWTHLAALVCITLQQVQPTFQQTLTSFRGMSGNRLLYFTYVKAVLNTLMVMTGFKNPGHFKFTPKAGNVTEGSGASGVIGNSSPLASSSPLAKEDVVTENGKVGTAATPASQSDNKKKSGCDLTQVHSSLSKVSEMRRSCMPLDGTLDIWILLISLCLSFLGAIVGVLTLIRHDALLKWDNGNDGLRWIGVVWAIADCTPALQFFGYVATYERYPRFLKIWCPLVVNLGRLAIVLIYTRMTIGFVFGV